MASFMGTNIDLIDLTDVSFFLSHDLLMRIYV